MTGSFFTNSDRLLHQQPKARKLLGARPPRFSPISPLILLCSALVIAGPIGCSDLLKQPAQAKALFSIEPGLPDASQSAPPTSAITTGPVLQVRPVRVSPPFDGVAFVYQNAPSQYALDYYNNFVASPSALLSGALLGWLEKAGPLPTVGAGTSVRSDLMLECEVTKLLIDFSDRANPHAVIVARFFLYSNRSGTTLVLLDRSYEVSKPLILNSPAGYSSAWGMAFREILQKLGIEIRNSLAQSKHVAN
jgi:uncharacterized lipoprotein YmbA